MPAPELVELCDEMGFMMMVEAFDEWDKAKCKNGYHLYFDEWAEKDLVNMIAISQQSKRCMYIGTKFLPSVVSRAELPLFFRNMPGVPHAL